MLRGRVVGIRRRQGTVGAEAVPVTRKGCEVEDQDFRSAVDGGMFLARDRERERVAVARGDDDSPSAGTAFRVIGLGEQTTRRVTDLDGGVIGVLAYLDHPFATGRQVERDPGGRRAEGADPLPQIRCRGLRGGAWSRGLGAEHGAGAEFEEHDAEYASELQSAGTGLWAGRGAVYTHPHMEVRDAEKDPSGYPAAERSSAESSTADPVEHLAAVYRDYPGLRALIMRRVRDPQVAADILQDAAVTTLEKLRAGEIARPHCIGGYLYRVALNHLRNYRRKDRTGVSSSAELESLPDGDDHPDVAGIDRAQWAKAARSMLEELPAARDRDLLVRFYLNDEGKEEICASLGLSDEHFNRVIFRARNRFRALLERRGLGKTDLLVLAFLGIGVSMVCAAITRCLTGGRVI